MRWKVSLADRLSYKTPVKRRFALFVVLIPASVGAVGAGGGGRAGGRSLRQGSPVTYGPCGTPHILVIRRTFYFLTPPPKLLAPPKYPQKATRDKFHEKYATDDERLLMNLSLKRAFGNA